MANMVRRRPALTRVRSRLPERPRAVSSSSVGTPSCLVLEQPIAKGRPEVYGSNREGTPRKCLAGSRGVGKKSGVSQQSSILTHEFKRVEAEIDQPVLLRVWDRSARGQSTVEVIRSLSTVRVATKAQSHESKARSARCTVCKGPPRFWL